MLEIIKRLEHYAKVQPQSIALQIDHEIVNYESLYQKICDCTLNSPKFKLGSRVALLSDSPIVNITNYFVILMMDGVPCFLDNKWSRDTIDKLIENYHIEYITTAVGKFKRTTSFGTYEKYKSEQLKVDDLLHIGFTSGTTGLPKAYYRNEPSWIASYVENEKLIYNYEKALAAPGPLAHSLSLYTCIYALYSGRTFIGQRQFDAKRFISILNEQHSNIALFLVPTMLHQLLNVDTTITHIKSIFSSGAKLSESLFKTVSEQFNNANIIEFFGTSEASFITYNFNQTSPTNSVGQVFPNVSIKLEAQDNRKIGLLKVQSNMIYSGYVDVEVVQPHSWIETGDYAYIQNNQLYLVSRKSDRLIIGGKNIYPNVIEQQVKSLEGIEEAVVVGEPHRRFGEIAVLIYVGNQELDYTTLRRYLRQTLSRYEIPSKLVRVKDLPFTNSGKVARNTVQTLYLEGAFKV
ncbi:long-chain fatty acid--CoA ligase [Staphylococcus haemolyticus]|uniref:long-chain fatty acid--CoA ligase n=1 Tax=Staphylococcus haemolyticus TaxID=1283 RepID=UPI000D1E787D|nr:long-chain fatty acid--CoA ligase [Staphylococcus haemolyticus]MCE5021644.1 long-chain fatty acid--CoA ligase [Staphylococcus haemolyticus]PTK51693.1 long-chain fatty acid--CoA ligase [Staphylococcus haemolyticus]PTK57507.1 long-chain fatty acid--CoA ligase [Staphylococcus haemolyticus]PTK68719.1 long-chain fatty acid--CoA ligase [Staphylococcus haemolyticus]PTL01466.1 long-chain fatty acid--CoA ligase [Staphylococcus haemolyticus]